MNDPTLVLDLLEGFRRSKTMFAAVQLGIFDGKRPEGAATTRLLDACVALGLLTEKNDRYRNTPVADAYLSTSNPRSLAGYVRYSDEAGYAVWAHLKSAVEEGATGWEPAFGPGSNVRKFMADKRRKRDFIDGMHGLGLLSSDAVVAAFDLSRFRCLVDLGGATGHLAAAANRRYPHMKTLVFDTPEVIEIAKTYVNSQTELVGGDFFSDPLPQADLFALGRILHGQSCEQIRCLLNRIRAVMPTGGGILLAESLLDDDRSGPLKSHMQSLNMLVVNGGRERTLAEYVELLRESGFGCIQSRMTGLPLDVVFASKVSSLTKTSITPERQPANVG